MTTKLQTIREELDGRKQWTRYTNDFYLGIRADRTASSIRNLDTSSDQLMKSSSCNIPYVSKDSDEETLSKHEKAYSWCVPHWQASYFLLLDNNAAQPQCVLLLLLVFVIKEVV